MKVKFREAGDCAQTIQGQFFVQMRADVVDHERDAAIVRVPVGVVGHSEPLEGTLPIPVDAVLTELAYSYWLAAPASGTGKMDDVAMRAAAVRRSVGAHRDAEAEHEARIDGARARGGRRGDYLPQPRAASEGSEYGVGGGRRRAEAEGREHRRVPASRYFV
ncbi:MAG: hypothetical protein ABIQ16_00645 [Polyangiaceae bacterium]